jgi:hypothetical protein
MLYARRALLPSAPSVTLERFFSFLYSSPARIILGLSPTCRLLIHHRPAVAGKDPMMRLMKLAYALVALFAVLSMPVLVGAQGLLGQRFFPTTLVIEDPSVSDEISFLIRHIKEPGGGEDSPTLVSELSSRYAKRVTSTMAITLEGTFRRLNPDEGTTENGFGNLGLGAKYELFSSARYEAVASLTLDVELGGTGKRDVQAESFSTISPGLVFGKGLGDLPASLSVLRPLAITGSLGADFPTRSKNVTARMLADGGDRIEPEVERNLVTLTWGFSVQYHLHYLQSFVKDVGLGSPFNRLIPLIEIPLETCLNRGCGGQTSGSLNPGVIWFGESLQLGVEAVIPLNSRSGKNVGVLGLVNIVLEELFPQSLGRPLLNGGR